MANAALTAFNIHDLREIARRRLPRVVFDFVDGGTEENITLRANRDVFERIRFQPRTLVDVSQRSMKTRLFDMEYAMPVGIAPTGVAGLSGFRADIALARAARSMGAPFILSTASTIAMEKVIAATDGNLWFQLYMSRDRALAKALVDRAKDAGYKALVMTTDVPVEASREYNKRNGFTVPFRWTGRTLVDGVLHPRWLFGVFLRTLLADGVPRLENLDTKERNTIVATPIEEFRRNRESLEWDVLKWLRDLWPRKLVVKGILHPADAQNALDCGADGILVSNHGGRQLDGAPAPVEVLAGIVDQVGSRMTVMTDSGFRRGADVVKALSLGAQAVFVGRPTLYGVAAGGEEGARHALRIFEGEIGRVLAMLGCPATRDLDRRFVALEAELTAWRGREEQAGSSIPRPLRAVEAS